MRRRDFIKMVGGSAAAWPLSARAQQPERMRRIGILTRYAEDDRDFLPYINSLLMRLEELGWSQGRNVRVDLRWAAGNTARLQAYAVELVNLKSDVIFGEGTPVIAALQQASRTVPIVFVGANNPIGSGFITSLARPGGNITGFIEFEPPMGGKWLEILKEIAPGVVRVALVYNPQTHTGQYFQSIETASRSLDVKLLRISFSNAAEIEREIADLAREPNSGLLVLPDTSTAFHRDLIVGLAAKHRLPAVYPYRYFIGALASYGCDRTDQFRKAAEYVHRILKGEKPSDLPTQSATKYELIINLRTAKALGLPVPPALLARANEVIE